MILRSTPSTTHSKSRRSLPAHSVIVVGLLIVIGSHLRLSAQSIETLIPTPRTSWHLSDTALFRIGPATMLVVPDSLTEGQKIASAWLDSNLKKRFGIVLQRRSISYYLRSLPPFQSAIVLLPANDPDEKYFRRTLFAHGENAPDKDGGYVLHAGRNEVLLWCRNDANSASNAVATFLALIQGNNAAVSQCHIWDQPDYPIRWIFSQHNLQVTSNVGILRSLADTMAALKLNGIYQNDFKLGILDRVSSQYWRNTDTLKQVWSARTIEVIPGVCGIGWSSNILINDPQLAEGLEARTLYRIEGDTGRCLMNPNVGFPNGGFESVNAQGAFTGFTYYDTCFHQDQSVKHSGVSSARGTNMPNGSNARFYRTMTCKPHEYYNLSAWFKTNACSADEFRIMVLADTGTNQYRALTFTSLNIAATTDWKKAEVFFNTLSYSKILVYVGAWGTHGGTLWIDDVELRPGGLCNILRRGGTPLSVQNINATSSYTEGVDFDPLHDPWWDTATEALGPYHSGPTFRIRPGSAIHNGDTLELRYYHPFAAVSDNQGNGSVMVCPSEDTLYAILRKQITEVNDLYHPKRFFMGHDEIRNMNHDALCLSRKLSPAELLADNIRRCETIIHEVQPEAQTFIWSDMLDSMHNAVNNYYLINGDLRNVWNLAPKDPIIVNWNGSKAKQSLGFFARVGYSQVTSPYYDAGNSVNIKTWRMLQEGVPNVRGMMYTTWNADYRFLRPFSYYAWSAGPYIIHQPIDTSVLRTHVANVQADVLTDPFDALDTLKSVVVCTWDGTYVLETNPMRLKSGRTWTCTFNPYILNGFEYSIRAVNSQGLTKETPHYRIRKVSDTASSVTEDAGITLSLLSQPVRDHLQIRLESKMNASTFHNVKFSIVDLLGRTVLTQYATEFSDSKGTIDISLPEFASGMYILVVNQAHVGRSLPFLKVSDN